MIHFFGSMIGSPLPLARRCLGYWQARQFTQNKLRYVDAVHKAMRAGACRTRRGGHRAARRVVASRLIGTGTALLFGGGVALGVDAGARDIRRRSARLTITRARAGARMRASRLRAAFERPTSLRVMPERFDACSDCAIPLSSDLRCAVRRRMDRDALLPPTLWRRRSRQRTASGAAARARHLQRADRDQHRGLRRQHDDRGERGREAVSRRRLSRGGHLPGRAAARQGQSRRPLSRRRGARKPLLLLAHLDVVAALQDRLVAGPRSVQVHRARRLLLRPRHERRQGDGVDLHRQPAALQAGGLRPRPRHHPRAHRGRRRRRVERCALADRQSQDLIDAAYALNEGGGGSLRDGKPFINSVGAAEKVSANFTVSTANRGGHSSVPRDDNAIYAARRGAGEDRRSYQFPVMLNEVTRAFFASTAKIETPEMGAAMRAIVANPNDAVASAIVSARSALPLDAAHDVRRDDARRRSRAQRAAADGDGERELPHGAGPRSGRRPRAARRRRSTTPA